MDFSETFMMECMNYTTNEFKLIENHLSKYIGDIDTIVYSEDEECYFGHIAIINPTDKYNFYTLITLGKDRKHSRKNEQIEFVICLPANWNFKFQAEKWTWPFALLQEIKAYLVTLPWVVPTIVTAAPINVSSSQQMHSVYCHQYLS